MFVAKVQIARLRLISPFVHVLAGSQATPLSLADNLPEKTCVPPTLAGLELPVNQVTIDQAVIDLFVPVLPVSVVILWLLVPEVNVKVIMNVEAIKLVSISRVRTSVKMLVVLMLNVKP